MKTFKALFAGRTLETLNPLWVGKADDGCASPVLVPAQTAVKTAGLKTVATILPSPKGYLKPLGAKTRTPLSVEQCTDSENRKLNELVQPKPQARFN